MIQGRKYLHLVDELLESPRVILIKSLYGHNSSVPKFTQIDRPEPSNPKFVLLVEAICSLTKFFVREYWQIAYLAPRHTAIAIKATPPVEQPVVG
jgi:hypothetical protein